MAINYNSSDKSIKTASTSHTFSYTCSSSGKRFLYVGVASLGTTSDICTGVTYGGISMTRVTTSAIGGIFRIYLYSLINPLSGANNIVVSFSSSNAAHIVPIDFYGVNDTTPAITTDAVFDNSATISALTSNALTTESGTYLVGYFGSIGNYSGTTIGTTKQVNNDATNSVTTSIGISGPQTAGTATITGNNNTANAPIALLSESFRAASTSSPKITFF